MSVIERRYIDQLNSEINGYNATNNSLQALRDVASRRQVTKTRVNITLTPEAIANLDRIATALNISRSELVERLARVGDERIMGLLREGEEGCDRNG